MAVMSFSTVLSMTMFACVLLVIMGRKEIVKIT